MTSDPQFELAPLSETEARRREVQLLVNVAEPDPARQTVLVEDETSLIDAVETQPAEIARRLNAYFGSDLSLDLVAPIWRLVDRIRRIRPGWPDDATTEG